MKQKRTENDPNPEAQPHIKGPRENLLGTLNDKEILSISGEKGRSVPFESWYEHRVNQEGNWQSPTERLGCSQDTFLIAWHYEHIERKQASAGRGLCASRALHGSANPARLRQGEGSLTALRCAPAQRSQRHRGVRVAAAAVGICPYPSRAPPSLPPHLGTQPAAF